MVASNEDPKLTAFTVTVDAKDGTTTGISAGDRAITLRALAHPEVTDTSDMPGIGYQWQRNTLGC